MSNRGFYFSVVSLLLIWLVVPGPFGAGAEGDEKETEQKSKSLLMGPFPLGDYYAKVRAHEELAKILGADKAPAEEAVVKALQGCQIFVCDEAVRRENGTWGFKYAWDAPPRVLVGGDLRFVVAGPEGNDVEIQLTKTDYLNSHTRSDPYSSDSSRSLRLSIQCRVKPKIGSETTWSIPGDSFVITYDVHGKLVQSQQD